MNINKNEVLRYLGYKKGTVDSLTMKEIENEIAEIKEIVRAKYIYNIFNIQNLHEQVEVIDTNLILKGKDITNHLRYSKKCAIMAASLGVDVDKRIMYYSKVDLKKSLILDACATTLIEAICDDIEDKIKQIASKEGYTITFRYSPGYGDFDLNIQQDILNVLDAYRKTGLTCTERCILLPRKSVTAIIGFHSGKEQTKKVKCINCNNKNCDFRMGGNCYEEN